MEEDNVKLSGAYSVFIPENIDGDISDYTEYKTSFYRSVPENCYLVTVNNFTGKVVNRGGRGFKITIPVLTKSILVPNIDRVVDYPRANYLTLDHITAGIDMAVTLKIVDPVKYINEGRYQLDQLSVLVQNLLRVYVQSLDFGSLSRGACDINKFDPNFQLMRFEDSYGIKVRNILFKEVKLPADLQKQYDDVIEAKKRREKQIVDLEAKKDEAMARKEIASVDSEIYVMKYKELISYFKEQGIPTEQIAELVRTQMISENANASFFVGDNDSAKNIAAGVAAGNGYTRKRTK